MYLLHQNTNAGGRDDIYKDSPTHLAAEPISWWPPVTKDYRYFFISACHPVRSSPPLPPDNLRFHAQAMASIA